MSTMHIVSRRMVTVPCILDIERTAKSLHAHVALEGIEVEPGDTVTVHDAPVGIAFGSRIRCTRSATVVRASWLDRFWARLTARFELTTLYEVGFLPRRRS